MSGPKESELAGKRVVVLGLGLFGGGLGAARWALARGANVLVTDLRSEGVLAAPLAELRAAPGAERLQFTLGSHDENDFRSADLIIANPAVPPGARPLAAARDAGVAITTATALVLDAASCQITAITGTHGKSSTSRFLATVLEHAGRRVHLGGNIGGSLLDTLDEIHSRDVIVLELSSYQLEHLPPQTRRALDVAAITNLGVDHLERHRTVTAYHAVKLRLLDLVRDNGTVILPSTTQTPPGRASANRASSIGTGTRHLTHGLDASVGIDAEGRFRLEDEVLGEAAHLCVPGEFQAGNAAVALAAARALGVSVDDCARSISGLRGLPHRLEALGAFEINGASIEVVDNGVSTTPDSTLSGMRSLAQGAEGRDLILVAGGKAKREQSFEQLATEALRGGWRVAAFGAAAPAIENAVREAGGVPLRANSSGGAPEDPEALIETLLPILADRTCVLFSPACASFDRYANFSARAKAFRGALRRVAKPSRQLPPSSS